MNLRRFLIEGATLVISAIILGLVANAVASTDRRVSLTASEPPSRQASETGLTPADSPSTIIEDDAMVAGEMPGEPPAGPVPTETGSDVPAPLQSSSGKASKSEILERFPPTPDIPAEEIHTDDAKWLWSNGALFLDARRTSIYNDGHIPGARSMPVWEADIDERVKAMSVEGLDTNMPVVIYCSGGECEDSHLLAQKLWGMFFNNLRVYHEGYPGWKNAGNQVTQGPQP